MQSDNPRPRLRWHRATRRHTCETGCSCAGNAAATIPPAGPFRRAAPAGSSGEDWASLNLIGSGRLVGSRAGRERGNDFHATVPVRFIGAEPLTLADDADDVPHCSSLFYVYCDRSLRDFGWVHVGQLQRNARVGGGGFWRRSSSKVQGLQVRLVITVPAARNLRQLKKPICLCFPYAAAMDLEMWAIASYYLKLTDNRLGFGKTIWEADCNEKIGKRERSTGMKK